MKFKTVILLFALIFITGCFQTIIDSGPAPLTFKKNDGVFLYTEGGTGKILDNLEVKLIDIKELDPDIKNIYDKVRKSDNFIHQEKFISITLKNDSIEEKNLNELIYITFNLTLEQQNYADENNTGAIYYSRKKAEFLPGIKKKNKVTFVIDHLSEFEIVVAKSIEDILKK
ncbi:hypothetical protein GF327_03570 [Candidatus Woesearchaeota archaeon]|nr:hypothetical protein [Candidatus Woesearchaeota archaeon]